MPHGETRKLHCRNGTVTLTATNLSFRPHLGAGDRKRWNVERDRIASVDVLLRSPLGWNLNIHTLDSRILRLDWVPANEAEELIYALLGAQGAALVGGADASLNASLDTPFDTAVDTDSGGMPPESPEPSAPLDLASSPVEEDETWEPALIDEQEPTVDVTPLWQVLPPPATSEPANDADTLTSNNASNTNYPLPAAPMTPVMDTLAHYRERAGVATGVAKTWLMENGPRLATLMAQMATRARQMGERRFAQLRQAGGRGMRQVRQTSEQGIARLQQAAKERAAAAAARTNASATTTPSAAPASSAAPKVSMPQSGLVLAIRLLRPLSPFWQRLRSASGNTQIGIGCGALLLVCALCLVISLSFTGHLGKNGTHSTPNTARVAFGNTPVVGITPAATATSTATNTPTPTPTPSPSPVPQLTLSFTCASAVNRVGGSVCVRTLPGAALQIRVVYLCNGKVARAASLQGVRIANAGGAYVWNWIPFNSCSGPTRATVTAHWNGQTVVSSDIFPMRP